MSDSSDGVRQSTASTSANKPPTLTTSASVGDGDEESKPFISKMAVSREQLTIDNNVKPHPTDSIFNRPSGCFVTRTKGFGFILLVTLLAVGVGFITYNMRPTCGSQCSTSTQPSDPLSTSSNDGNKDASESHPTNFLLPTNLRPTHYKLQLIPHVDPVQNFTLDGSIAITLEILQPTSSITLHIKNITINETSVGLNSLNTTQNLQVQGMTYDLIRHWFVITFNENLRAGEFYLLSMKFQGLLGDELAGFYRSSYTDLTTSQIRWIAVTQFQATDARRAFPCFDEPRLKAEFEISLGRLGNMTSLSNMNLLETVEMEGHPDWVWDHYARSVPMSTYLVAMAVTDFAHLESDPSSSRTKFQVWAREDAIQQANFSSDVGPRILNHFEQYFNVGFPLPKLDMIALPDFSAGAMENWGLITFRETAMLFDPKVSSDSSRQRVAVVISHEIAHQWFGNLVTPSWWSDLWLNEGFASYVEYIGVDFVFPEWKILEQFVTDEVHEVFGLDALDSSHPISVEVHHPDEISEIFDTISYAKGATIIRMMNHFLGQTSFTKGLTNYLNKWQFKNAEQGNLWTALTDQAHLDKSLDKHLTVAEIMDTWTLQKGFPIINVERKYPQKVANFTQTKFSLVRNETLISEYEGYRWWVPISYASNDFNSNFTKTQPEFWIPKTLKSIEHEIHADKWDWLIVNIQETGFYRVNYDPKNWNLIVDQLSRDHSKIHSVNRAQLLDDSLNLARAGILPYETAFNVTEYLGKDGEYLPWEAFLNNFHYLLTMLQRSSSFGLFKKYMVRLLEKQYDQVGFAEQPNDPMLTKYHRLNIISLACNLGHKDCIVKSRGLFNQWMNMSNPDANNPIPTNFRRLVYCNGIRWGGEAEWDFAWQRYLSSNVASEKNIILTALSCTREPWMLTRFMTWSVTPNSGIRKQDSRSVLMGIAGNEIGNYLAFNFVRDQWLTIKAYFSTGFSMGRVIKGIAAKQNTAFELQELQNFKRKYQKDLGSSARAVDQAIESVQANVDWMNKNFQTITAWLLERTK